MMHEDRKPQVPAPLNLFVWAGTTQPQLPQEIAGVLPRDTVLHSYVPEDLAAALEAGKPCAATWRDPLDMLADAIASGQPVGPALDRWQETASGLLTLFRRNRRRLVLLSEAALASDDPETRTQLCDRLGLAGDFRLSVAPAPEEDLSRLLAELAVPQLDQLRPLLSELEASSIFCHRPTFDPLRLERAGRQLARIHERQRLLADQLRFDHSAHESDLAEIRHQTREAETRTMELAAHDASLRSQLDARQKQIAQLQQKVTALTIERDRYGADVRALQAQLDDLQKQIMQLQQQATDRDRQGGETGLLRDQIRFMQQALDELMQERDGKQVEMAELARTADHAVRKALAEARMAAEARARVEAELAEAHGERDQLRREVEQLQETRAHVDRMSADLAALHATLIARENDLAEMRASTATIFASNSWKITAPLRRVSLMLGRHRG